MAKKETYHRSFLNKRKGTAAIEWYVDGNSASVKITDCNRAVNLDFDTYGNVRKEDNLFKINKLVEEITKFRETFVKENQ